MATNRIPMLAHPADGHGGAPNPRSRVADIDDGDHDEQAPPLPSNPKMRAEMLAGIQQGIAEADAGLGIPWKVVKAEMEAIITSKRK